MSGQVQLADIMDTLQVIQATMTTIASKADLEALRAETTAGIDTLRTHTQAGFEALSEIHLSASRLPNRAPAEGVRPRPDQRAKVWDPVL